MIPLGVCPICGFDRMIMVSNGNCQFDACPKCGFGHGYISKRAGRKKLRNQKLWDHIVKEQPIFSLEEEELTREKVLGMLNKCDPAVVMKARKGTDSVFKYSDKEIVKNSLKLGVNSRQAIEAARRLGMIPSDQELSVLNPKPR